MTGDGNERKRAKKTKEEDKVEEQTDTTEFEDRSSSPAAFTAYVFGFPYETDIAAYLAANLPKLDQPVAVRAHTWHDSGKSKGCAHLDFASQALLDKAISLLEGRTVGKRYLGASVANEQQSVGETTTTNKQPSKRLFVKNLPYEMTEAELSGLFGGKFGEVSSVRIPHWNHTGKAKGFGYVEFADVQQAEKCMQHHLGKPLSLQGRRLVLDYDSGAPKRGFKLESGRAWYKSEKE